MTKGETEKSAVLNVKDDEVGQAGSAVAIMAMLLSLHGIITNSDNCASTAQFMLGRAKSPSSAVSPRN